MAWPRGKTPSAALWGIWLAQALAAGLGLVYGGLFGMCISGVLLGILLGLLCAAFGVLGVTSVVDWATRLRAKVARPRQPGA